MDSAPEITGRLGSAFDDTLTEHGVVSRDSSQTDESDRGEFSLDWADTGNSPNLLTKWEVIMAFRVSPVMLSESSQTCKNCKKNL